MTSQKRNILIGIGVLAILGCAYLIGNMSGGKDAPEEESQVLISQPDFKVSELKIETQEKSAVYVKEGTDWVVVGQEDTGLVQIAIDQLIAYVKTLDYTAIAAENMNNAADFGLTEGSRLTLTDDRGERIILTVGDKTVDSAGWYVNIDGDKRIYIVPSEAGAALKKGPDDMRDRYPEYVNYDNSAYISVSKGDGTSYRIEPNPEGAPAVGYGEYILKGYYANDMLLITESLRDIIGAPLYNIYALEFIDEPGDLSQYGLITPALTVEALDNDGNTCTIWIGDQNESGNYYAAFSNKPYVAVVNGNNVDSIAGANLFHIIGSLYVPLNMGDIANIQITEGTATYDFTIDGAQGLYTFNGENKPESQITDVLKYISVLTADGEIDDIAFAGGEVVSIQVRDRAGKVYDLTFLDYDDNYYAVNYNGAVEFVTGKKSLDLILNAVKSI